MAPCPRVAAWQLLFLGALALNIFLLSTLASQWLGTACTSSTIRSEKTLAPARRAQKPPAKATHGATKGSSSRELFSNHVSRAGDCSSEEEGGLARALCLAESSSVFHSPLTKPVVIAKDVTRSRYFAQRDLQGWILAFENISFNVEEVHRKNVRLSEFSVYLCLGITLQDRSCLRPASYHLLGQGQRFNQIHGIRESLWRKDGMCLTLREALATYDGPRNFTFPCWVLPTDMVEFRVCCPYLFSLFSPPSLSLSLTHTHTLNTLCHKQHTLSSLHSVHSLPHC